MSVLKALGFVSLLIAYQCVALYQHPTASRNIVSRGIDQSSFDVSGVNLSRRGTGGGGSSSPKKGGSQGDRKSGSQAPQQSGSGKQRDETTSSRRDSHDSARGTKSNDLEQGSKASRPPRGPSFKAVGQIGSPRTSPRLSVPLGMPSKKLREAPPPPFLLPGAEGTSLRPSGTRGEILSPWLQQQQQRYGWNDPPDYSTFGSGKIALHAARGGASGLTLGNRPAIDPAQRFQLPPHGSGFPAMSNNYPGSTNTHASPLDMLPSVPSTGLVPPNLEPLFPSPGASVPRGARQDTAGADSGGSSKAGSSKSM